MSRHAAIGPTRAASALHLAVDLLVLGGIWLFLLSYFRPELLFSATTTTGGDTGSHYAFAHLAVNRLLDQGSLLGWAPGNLAGHPLFQLYFPLPFAVMAGLSQLCGLPVAFKLVSAGGAFLLPLGLWGGLRLARLPFPAPALGAVFSLPFLFNETQAMWGGNIASLLAGEFAYSLGLALLALWLGAMYRDLDQRRHLVINGVLLAGVGMCHGCTLLFGVLAGGLWLLARDPAPRLVYLLKVYGLAFCLMGVWIVPLLVFSPYNTMHNMIWNIDAWQKVVPPIMMPLMALCLIHLAITWVRRQTGPAGLAGAQYFAGLVALALLLYLAAFRLNVIDIRFFPFAWLALCAWAAVAVGAWTARLRARFLVPLFFLMVTSVGVSWQVSYLPHWINWNYTGFESRAGWPDFQRLNKFLAGGVGDPRVLHEHSDRHESIGTTRAFENLPFFSGRNTMEGLYIQSSVASPFVFYLQSLTTEHPTMPLNNYTYGRFDLRRAARRMALFNVGQFVAVSDRAKRAARQNPGYEEQVVIGPYAVFKVKANPGDYAVALRFKPVLLVTRRWKELAYAWFRGGDLEVPLVFKAQAEPGDEGRFAAVWHDRLGEAPRIPFPAAGRLAQQVAAERIEVQTPNRVPVLVKISYHPNWRVSGAQRIYLAAPCFMLIYPQTDRVVLRYGQTWPNYLGQALTLLALLLVLFSLPLVRGLPMVGLLRRVFLTPWALAENLARPWLSRLAGWVARHAVGVSLAVGLLVGVLLVLYIASGGREDSSRAFRQALSTYQAKQYQAAGQQFQQALQRWPGSSIADSAALHWGLSLYLQGKWRPAIRAFEHLVTTFPDSRKVPEALYHIGLCRRSLGQPNQARQAFNQVARDFPHSPWASHAKQRIQESKP